MEDTSVKVSENRNITSAVHFTLPEFYYMKANMWNGFTKCYEKFASQGVRSKEMMCGVNDG
jgi:hypothetical protein